jgi:hypothetical protein
MPTSFTLYWSASSGMNRYEYCLDTTDDDACTTGWINNTTKRSVTLTGLNTGTTYYWQVRANNNSGSTYANGAESAYRSFTTAAPPTAFNKLSPADGATNLPTSLTLYWTASSGMSRYEYCLDTTDDDACTTGWINNTTKRSVILSGLLPGVTYYWQVRAINSFGTTYANGTETSFWSFTTAP